MRTGLLKAIGAMAVILLALVFFRPPQVTVAQEGPVPSAKPHAMPSTSAPALKTPWGEPDLQGIWMDESDTPLQRSPKYANQEFFTEAQRAELDKERAALLGRDKRVERGTELDVAGAYNAAFMSIKHTGVRTSLIVDPPNGRIPPLTPEAQKRAVVSSATSEPGICPNLAPHMAAASAALCRRRAASPCSTTSARGKDGNAISL